MRRRRSKIRSLYVWHRYAGVSAAVLVLLLALTGVALNHGDALHLERRFVGAAGLLDWYGIGVEEPVSFRIGGRWVSAVGRRLYLDARALPVRIDGALRGALQAGPLLVAASTGGLLLLTAQGTPVERIGPAQGAPSGIEAIAAGTDGAVRVRTAHGIYRVDLDRLDWSADAAPQAAWIAPAQAPAALRARLRRDARAHVLSWERVLLDVHSGRILGAAGTWLTDAAAAALVFLAVSGLRLWVRGRRSRARR